MTYDFGESQVMMGDGCRIDDGVRVRCGHLVMADHVTLNRGVLIHGSPSSVLYIGHHCWVGEGAILNCTGNLHICDRVGIGPGSQVWTHAKWGDESLGPRFNDRYTILLEGDVCLSGHVLVVGNVVAHARSMALPGAVVTKDMAADHVYAGVPARDVTWRVGSQFDQLHVVDADMVLDRCEAMGVEGVNVGARTYRKTRKPGEVEAVRELARTTIKLVPEA